VNLRNAVGIVLLAGAAGASYWWSRPPPPGPDAPAGGGAELPGYYVYGARITATDEQGRVALQINAETLRELPDEQFALKGVHIDYTPADDTPWSMNAGSAIAPKDQSRFDLEGDVDMRSAPTDGSRPMQILAAAIQFEPHESRVTSKGSVEVRVGDGRFTGTGFHAVLNAKQWGLESDVHARFSR
jgi:LPS export ABC transporter protein LptC